ncbi:unnamed protein product [Rotaria magnacalcarata]
MATISITDNHLSANNNHNHTNSVINANTFGNTSNVSYDQRQPQAKKKTKWYQHQTSIRICFALWFTIILATVGIIIICLAQPDSTHLICEKTFISMARKNYTYDSRPRYVAVADFNNDNHLDLAVANSIDANIVILLGDGNGTFSRQYTNWFYDESGPYWIGVGDFNNDTLLDIAVANYDSHDIDILRGYGNGTFSIEFTLGLGSSRPMLLTVGNFNEDNILDIAVASNGTLDLTILIGSGDGSFEIQTNYYLGHDSMPYSIDVADFNYDNKTDIMIVDYGTSNLIILFATENATEQFLIGSSFSRKSIGAGNLNIGSTLDLIVVDSGTNSVIVYEGSGDGTFIVKANHSTGTNSNPYSFAVGAFDHDSISDVVVANYDINSILVLRSYTISLISTENSWSPDSEFQPLSMIVYDINNDQNLDVIAADGLSNSVVLFLGDGNGSFDMREAFSIKNDHRGPYLIAVGNFNNDNQTDIVVTLYLTYKVRIYFGQKNGSFVQGYECEVSQDWMLMVLLAGDFNDDKNLDLVVGNAVDGQLAILLGDGNGSLGEPLYYTSVYSSGVLVAMGDFNSDNITDFAIANSDSHAFVISLGNGDGTFKDPTYLSNEDYYTNCLVIGDLNKDTIVDIVITIPDNSGIGISLGKKDGTFESMYFYDDELGSYPMFVVLNYFNIDRNIDIAILNSITPSIDILYGNGDGTFRTNSKLNLENGSDPFLMATGDFNKDGEIDIVTANTGSNDLSLLLLQDEPDFINENTYPQKSGAHPSAATVGHFNNDLRMDIVVVNSGTNEVRILMNYNSSTFMKTATYSTGENSHPQQAVVADFNKDNQLDIAVVNSWSDTLKVFLISNNGTTANSTEYSTGSKSSPNSLAVGDFNKDGWTDIVVANKKSSNIGVFLGYNYPTFNSQIIRIEQHNSYPTYVVVGDFNGDSQWDIAVTCFKKNNVSVFLGLGKGTFENETSNPLPTSSYPTAMVVGDFNNDNQSDIVVVNSRGKTISVLLGYGNGTFATDISKSTGSSSPVFIAMGDFNKDNKLDIAVAFQTDDNVGVFTGYGNGSFSEQMTYKMPNVSSPVWVTIGDFNKDNVQDMAVANFNGNHVGILLGYGNGTFGDIIIYSTGTNSGPCAIAVGDFNKDNNIDIAVANLYRKTIGIMFGYGNGSFLLQVTY